MIEYVPSNCFITRFGAAVSVLVGHCCPALLKLYRRKCAYCCIIGQIKWWRWYRVYPSMSPQNCPFPWEYSSPLPWFQDPTRHVSHQNNAKRTDRATSVTTGGSELARLSFVLLFWKRTVLNKQSNSIFFTDSAVLRMSLFESFYFIYKHY